jgi:glyoxylase-like metal-dependent hydrolase (beta-lactamase superfamily II)
VFRFSHGVSNFYLVEEGGKMILIDAGVSGDWGPFLKAARSMGRSLDNLEAILLTHAHSDHTGFAERARTEAGSRVWVHEADSAVARGGHPPPNEARLRPYLRYRETWRTLFGLLLHGGVKIVPVLDASTFKDGQVLDVAGRPQAILIPGHTAGMAAIFLERRGALFTGDGLVTRNPLTGRVGPQIMPRALNRSSAQALESLGRLRGVAAELLLPGHGEPWRGGIPKAVDLARMAGIS